MAKVRTIVRYAVVLHVQADNPYPGPLAPPEFSSLDGAASLYFTQVLLSNVYIYRRHILIPTLYSSTLDLCVI